MRRRGFTFIEMLLVATLIGTISLAVFSCLRNGIRLWDRSRQAVLAEDASIFFDRFSSDVRNAFFFSTLPFKGEEYSFEFPTIVSTPADRRSTRAEEGTVDQLGRVSYSFDAVKGTVIRRQADYADGTREAWGEPRVLLSGIKQIRFKYYYSGQKDYQLHAEGKDVLPARVEVELSFMDGQEERILRRLVPVPLGI
ncbi:MAG: prepilin-type N-terminal cleavage/methylation domain-containing protein [Candidatus Omnitrophica bacterium]|nr:prepilin-type N-terminal cleavage/methylation domain-containing protein [Candidatus Omnitrophota bacterium]